MSRAILPGITGILHHAVPELTTTKEKWRSRAGEIICLGNVLVMITQRKDWRLKGGAQMEEFLKRIVCNTNKKPSLSDTIRSMITAKNSEICLWVFSNNLCCYIYFGQSGMPAQRGVSDGHRGIWPIASPARMLLRITALSVRSDDEGGRKEEMG